MIIKLERVLGLEKLVDMLRERPEVEAIELPKSQVERISSSARSVLKARGIYLITRYEGLGRPSFRKSAELVRRAKKLKAEGVGLTTAAKVMGIPESTLYQHIWKDLK